MNVTCKFSLEGHAGPYEKWPLRSRLMLDGKPTGTSLAGYCLLHQFEIVDGYFLVHDWDCPFEEMTHFTLLDRRLRILSSCCMSVPYASWLLTHFSAIDDRHFEATFAGDDRWQVTIRRAIGVRYLLPRVVLRRRLSQVE